MLCEKRISVGSLKSLIKNVTLIAVILTSIRNEEGKMSVECDRIANTTCETASSADLVIFRIYQALGCVTDVKLSLI